MIKQHPRIKFNLFPLQRTTNLHMRAMPQERKTTKIISSSYLFNPFIRWVYFQSNLFLLSESGCGYGKRLSRLLGMVVSRDSIRTGTLFNFDLWNAIRAYIRCRRPRVGREDNETLINFYGFPCCSCYNPRSGLVKHQTRSEE